MFASTGILFLPHSWLKATPQVRFGFLMRNTESGWDSSLLVTRRLCVPPPLKNDAEKANDCKLEKKERCEGATAPGSNISAFYPGMALAVPCIHAKGNICRLSSPLRALRWGSLSVLTALSLALSLAPTGQFLLEESRMLEAAEMAQTAARLDGEEFDVVFSAAHMLRWAFGFAL